MEMGICSKFKNVIDTEKTIRIEFYESKNKRWWNFIMETEENEYASLIREYIRLRSQIKEEEYFFPPISAWKA